MALVMASSEYREPFLKGGRDEANWNKAENFKKR